jgi:hypothetical protein
MQPFLRVSAAVAAAAVLTFAPISVKPTALVEEGPSAVLRLNTACGQATSCRERGGFICSTHHSDYMDYICYTGCSPTIT